MSRINRRLVIFLLPRWARTITRSFWIHRNTVGASLLAMDVNDDVFILDERGALETIASRLAPTVFLVVHRSCIHPLTL
ncbi:hypothetical protein EMIT0196MI5_10462 [Pseudomonas sp. IT-196MI5]